MDVLRVVSTLRQDRTGCVQTREQYRFIHQVSTTVYWLQLYVEREMSRTHYIITGTV